MGTVIDLDSYRNRKGCVYGGTKAEHTGKQPDNSVEGVQETALNLDVLKLKLELVNRFETSESMETIRKYGKAKNGIIREVLVPGRMSLHAAHYMIQKLFGWQNSHLHHFELPECIFKGLTQNSVKTWAELCGVLFRFPEGDDFSDAYWDDDYDNSISVKTWLKRKYTDEEGTFSVGDCYLDNLRKTEEFERWVDGDKKAGKIFGGRGYAELSLEELKALSDIGIDVEHLTERLELGELLYVKGKGGKRENLQHAAENIALLIDQFNEMVEEEFSVGELDHYASAAERLRALRRNYQEIDRLSHSDPDRIKKELGKDPFDVKMEYKWAIEEMQDECCEYINDWNPDIVPVADGLTYYYDYGDGWEVKITCEEGYHAVWENDDFDYTAADGHEILEHILSIDEDAVFYDSSSEKASEDLQNTLNEIQYLGKPLCVYADGLNVMDDVGGYGGYLDFLETIHGADRYAAKEMRDWARQMGWTGRTSKPENML